MGYVSVKITEQAVTVKGKVTPEHKTTQTPYEVSVDVNNVSKSITNAACTGCKAQNGGCKHTIAFVFWLLRRSEEEAVTDVKCYWKRATLSGLKGTGPFTVSEEEAKLKHREPVVDAVGFREAATRRLAEKGLGAQTQVVKLMGLADDKLQKLNMDRLVHGYLDNEGQENRSLDRFLQYCETVVANSDCEMAQLGTMGQANAPAWHHLRYGRITASRLFEAARCRKGDGHLVEALLGATQFSGTPATKRGSQLEGDVLKEFEKAVKCKCDKSGLFVNKERAIFGASPDSLIRNSDGKITAVVEVKCPMTMDSVPRYVSPSGVIQSRYRAQLQLQMLLTGCSSGYFCVAAPNFEQTREVRIVKDVLCPSFLMPLINQAKTFWYCAVFPQLIAGRYMVPQ